MSANAYSHPSEPASGYLRVLAGRWRVVVATLAVCLGAAAIVLALTPKSYTANAEILVSPISAAADEDFVGVPVLRDSAISPTTSVLTVARLVKSPETVAIARRRYGGGAGASLASKVSVTPLSQTSIVQVSASGSSPEAAARLANTFANATIARQTAVFQRALRATVETLQRQSIALHGTAVATQRGALQARLAVLTPLVGASDPTLHVLSPAVPPASAAEPRPLLTLGAAAIAGLLLGALLVFLREATDPRVRRVDQVLAELPLDRRAQAVARIGHAAARSRGAAAAVRPLVARLLAAAPAGSASSIVVVSAGEGEGRTSAAVAIARAAARLRRRVVLADCDVAHPSVADAFGIEGHAGSTALQGSELVHPVPGEPNVLLTLPPHVHPAGQPTFDPESAAQHQAKLREQADVVVVDSPAAATDPTAVALAGAADAVVVVARLGRTRKEELRELREILADAHLVPAGMVVLGPTSAVVVGRDGLRRALRKLGGAVTAVVSPLRDPYDDPGAEADGDGAEELQAHLAPARRAERADVSASLLAGGSAPETPTLPPQ